MLSDKTGPIVIDDPHPRVAGKANDVDVIILSWNRTDDLLEAITSARNQAGPTRRILIVDQGSEPQNIERLERFIQDEPDILLKKMGWNTGVAGGRNIATAMGHGRYIVALDSDAVFADSTALARAVQHLDRHRHLGAIGFRIENYFTRQNDALSWDYPGSNPDQRFFTTRFIGAGHAIRRRAFEAVGGYDARLFFCGEELDLSYRMLNLGFRIEYLPDINVRHKVSPDHRIAWEQGRYFFTVRNALYTSYKFGIPISGLGLAAMAFLVQGASNGVIGSALRGIFAAIRLCAAYRRSTEDKSAYQLSPDTWRYIKECEPWHAEDIVSKIRRQFKKLPTKT
jgi:GT2 family glycosyltransferase